MLYLKLKDCPYCNHLLTLLRRMGGADPNPNPTMIFLFLIQEEVIDIWTDAVREPQFPLFSPLKSSSSERPRQIFSGPY